MAAAPYRRRLLTKALPQEPAPQLELLDDDQHDVQMAPPESPPPVPDAAGHASGGRGKQRKDCGKEAACSGTQPGGLKKSGAQPGGQKKGGAQPARGNDGDGGKEFISCRRCKKPKEVGKEISKKCADCKTCRADYECCQRMAVRQGKADWFKETETNDPRNFAKLLTTYSKCCPRNANNYNRRHGKFPLMQFISEISVEGGKRVERAFKMMWEREYIEEAQKTYMGNLTTEEAKRQWEEWKANPEHPRDQNGPEGFCGWRSRRATTTNTTRRAPAGRRGSTAPSLEEGANTTSIARRTWPTARSSANVANGAQPGEHG